jgi:hypothetical protein
MSVEIQPDGSLRSSIADQRHEGPDDARACHPAEGAPTCPWCHAAPTDVDSIGNLWCEQCGWYAVCASCGTAYRHPQSNLCRDGHEAVGGYHPFTPYFDIGLGKEISSLAERKTEMRRAHFDYRDHPSPGELTARKDKLQEARKERIRQYGPRMCSES